ncbi:hypothetical protein XENOCAPTIV_022405 [Xenoophorus captivus]|uniref:Uncharacterized protein n=1 Tax=Xenoophorus captivus TaxID=1517983 RepID=A0ABV0QU71_9TELE
MNRMSSQGSSASQRRRMALGVVILLLVDVIWVASSELTTVSMFHPSSPVSSNIMEVRQLPSTQALEAKLSRMSYPAAKDQEALLRTVGKLTITDVAKISFFFCFVKGRNIWMLRTLNKLNVMFSPPLFVLQWFLANLSYQEALSDTQVAIVNILSSTSGDCLSGCPPLYFTL